MKHQGIEQLLPGIFQRTARMGSPLYALLQVMEALHGPSEAALEDLDTKFNPRRTPDAFVPFLARWVDLERILERAVPGQRSKTNLPSEVLSTGLGNLRELVACAARLSKWRGTRYGLIRFLQAATGESGFEVIENQDSTGEPRLFHLVFRAPGTLRMHRSLLERIVESEKPAYVTYELVIGPKVQE